MELFSHLHKEGTTVVLVTHEEEIAAFTERIIRFRDGEIISDETNIPHEPEFSRHVERNTDFEPEEVSGGKEFPC